MGERLVDVEPEQKRHRKGPVDPTGAVSSGIQTGPLRGTEELRADVGEEAEDKLE